MGEKDRFLKLPSFTNPAYPNEILFSPAVNPTGVNWEFPRIHHPESVKKAIANIDAEQVPEEI